MIGDDCPEDMEVDPLPEKPNKEKLSRGEKSRIAAKSRRDKEMIAMNNLMQELPISYEVLNKMHKSSVIRLAICYIKIKHFIQKDILAHENKSRNLIFPSQDAQFTAQDPGSIVDEEGKLMLETLNGFLIFVSKKGIVRFVSPSVSDHLGLKQENLIGQNLMDIVHPNDQQELLKQISTDDKADNKTSNNAITKMGDCLPCQESSQKVFYLRMRYNLPKTGSKAKHTGYMLVQWTGKMKKHVSSKTSMLVTDGLLCVCRPMQTTPLVEIRMDGNMFMSRHDLGMTFTFCDNRIITLIGYEPNELLGKTAYHFHNPIDAPKVSDCHQNLIVKGTSVSKYYRFLGKTDNWVWLQTRATIIYNTNNKPQYIVCMNYVISEEEGERYLMLEEHKHANNSGNNTVITLPDNHHNPPFSTQCCNDAGPKIVELCEENLKQTACLNGELDRPPPQNGCPPPTECDNITATSIPNSSTYLNNQSLSMVENSNYSLNNYQQTVPSIQDKSNNISQQITQQPVTGDLNQGSSLIPVIPQSTLQAENTDVTGDYDMMVVSQDSPDSSSTLSYTGSPTSQCNDKYTATPAEQVLDKNYGNSAALSCHGNRSSSEDGGYESASSPYSSSYYSPQIGSSYSSDTSDTMAGNALIQGQNCNLGAGYRGTSTTSVIAGDLLQEGNTSYMYENNANAEVPDAENIIDELLQSFNQQDSLNNLDMSMAAVYSTIESLTTQTSSSVSKNVINLTAEFPKHPPSPAAKPVGKKSDKPLLRSFLTMPEDDIPTQPLTFLKACNKMNKCKSKSGNILNRSCQGNQINFSAQNTSVSQGNRNGLESYTATKIAHPEHGGCQTRLPTQCQDQTGELDLSEMPEDISDFALQYLDSITDAQAQAVIADLNSDTFMDTAENDLTKDFLSSLENHCPPTSNETINPFNNLTNISCRNVNTQKRHLQSQNYPEMTAQSVASGCQSNRSQSENTQHSISSHDHVYYQSSNRLNGHNNCKSPKSATNQSRLRGALLHEVQGPTYCSSETQTTMSELERHLRDKTEDRCGGTIPNKISSKPFLQQLLTGELTKDGYMQMERERCNQGKALTPQ